MGFPALRRPFYASWRECQPLGGVAVHRLIPSALRWAISASLLSSLALALAAGYGLCCSSSAAHLASFLCQAASLWCQARSALSCLLSILCLLCLAPWGFPGALLWSCRVGVREWLALPLSVALPPGSTWLLPGYSLGLPGWPWPLPLGHVLYSPPPVLSSPAPWSFPGCYLGAGPPPWLCLALCCATAGPAVLPRRSLACSVAPAALMDSCLSIVCDITAALVPCGFQGDGSGWLDGDYRSLVTQILAS
ncbi:hypothetical protein C5022_000001 [Pseudomonas phage vB_PaeP_130_113]|uniref:Uncharacterized protein n=1 Tax=Pseudomonas phage vB_PaeP_130_113 TaxID=2161784 RepID=A0A2R4P9A9_9CAUD|nr:hypothetical protein HOT07_gp01 [Pseudomonas phage vB_PaeP_130_113]AVX47604.1 hypothetical protein C5022_000001 [Pseudomonas phage vB_PaeP_130_113]